MRFLAGLSAAGTVAGLLLLNGYAQAGEQQRTVATDWLSPAAYQERFDLEFLRGYYPVRVEGRLREDQSQYRASFQAFPSTSFKFLAHVGLPEGFFLTRDAELKAQGFRLVWTQNFFDTRGNRRFQATWVQ